MGTTCRSAPSGCCGMNTRESMDLGGANAAAPQHKWKSSIHATVDLSKIEEIYSDRKTQMAVEERIIKIQACIRMKLATRKFSNMKFLYLITGKKTFPEAWLDQLPESGARLVLQRQREHGPLLLNDDHKIQIYENILGKHFNPAIKIGAI